MIDAAMRSAQALIAMCVLCPGVLTAQAPRVSDSIPGSLVVFEVVRVPGGAATLPDGGEVEVADFWIARTEVTWDAFDIYAFQLDKRGRDNPPDADAIARPSRPYGAPDWGFGHQGYAALSMTRHAAETYCEWLSAMTGHRYRLPTEAEWRRALALAFPELAEMSNGELEAFAWFADNAEGKTHAVGLRQPDALGLFDLLGNAAEWVIPADSARVTMGGSYRDTSVNPVPRARQTSRWNETDPQIPKSTWWLSDGSFVGFRVVREMER